MGVVQMVLVQMGLVQMGVVQLGVVQLWLVQMGVDPTWLLMLKAACATNAKNKQLQIQKVQRKFRYFPTADLGSHVLC